MFKVWKRGRAAARAWQHDWRDGSWKQAYQGPTPEIKNHHWSFPCQSSSLGTFIIIKNATDNHHHINGWKADQGQVSEMKTYILIQFFFNHIITAAITQVFLQVSMANQKNRAENGQ